MARALPRMVPLLLVMAAGCDRDTSPEAPPTGPEQTGTFLNTPAGTPPAPMVPEFVSIHVAAATDLPATTTKATARFGAARVTLGSGERTPLLPALRVDVGGPKALTRDAVAELRASGARGNLVFWYPLADVRDRLGDGGTAGLWRGILVVRDAVPGAGELGGTPVLQCFAVAASDRSLLDVPAVGPADAPKSPPAIFAGPGGTPVVYVPSEHAYGTPGFEATVERLNAIRNQGGQVWVLFGLPLAQPHIPPRF